MLDSVTQSVGGLADRFCYSTGIRGIDEIVGCVTGGTIVEFFGDIETLARLSYILVARWSCYGGVALLIAQRDPLLYDFYEIKRRASMEGCDGPVKVSRSFRLEDTVLLLQEAALRIAKSYVLFDPFVHTIDLPLKERYRTNSITKNLRRLSGLGARVAVFNRSSVLSSRAPEGGSLYRHTVHISLMIEETARGGLRARLLKHPYRGPVSVSLSIYEIEEGGKWVGQALLSEWL